MGYWDYFEPSRPRAAKGGIKSQSARGGFGDNWWARRWIEVLDSCGIGARLTRGRSYARKGQVLSIEFDHGGVRAEVQGSQPDPYEVTIALKPFLAQEWDRVIEQLSGQAVFAAKLLAAEMPHEIEAVFKDAGLSLFPGGMSELTTECSCPDWSNPCKHTAAVYCLLGEEFDRDPFLIFALRGMTQEELRTRLSGMPAVPTAEVIMPPAHEPLSVEAGEFWNGRTALESEIDTVQRPPVSAHLLRRLGNFPFWRGDVPILEALNPVYSAATDAGLSIFLGETQTGKA